METQKSTTLPEYVETENGVEFIRIPQVSLEELIPGIKEKQKPEFDHGNSFDCLFVGHHLRSIFDSHVTPQAFQDKLRDATEHGDAASVKSLKEKYPHHYAISRFKDQIVVDLGCGHIPNGYFLALLGGARGYVGVDKFEASLAQGNLFHPMGSMYRVWRKIAELYGFGKVDEGPIQWRREGNKSIMVREESAEFNHSIEQIAQKIGPIPANIEAEDMLEFVKRLPDGSVSFLMSGIDETIITRNFYSRPLSEEMGRAMHRNGVVATMDGGLSPSWDTAEETIKTERFRRSHVYTYEKMPKSEIRPRNVSHEFETMNDSDFAVFLK
ncbi:MAG: hypothetical protein AAB733_00510, partial [Patescibacteria group bacterium]